MSPEEIKPYEAGRSKGEQIEEMFDSIAPAYDFMNTAMTFGMHRRWLRKALAAAFAEEGGEEPESIVDLATGTGEVAFKLASLYPKARISGIDLSEGMLGVACKKLAGMEEAVAKRISFRQGDCLNLDFPENSFDFLTIAYGVRNFENLRKGFREFSRVVKPGGKCMILELSRPENRILRLGYDVYTRTFIPIAGRLFSHDVRAYSYLPESVAAMPRRQEIASMLKDAGFAKVSFKPMTMGVVTYYIAEK